VRRGVRSTLTRYFKQTAILQVCELFYDTLACIQLTHHRVSGPGMLVQDSLADGTHWPTGFTRRHDRLRACGPTYRRLRGHRGVARRGPGPGNGAPRRGPRLSRGVCPPIDLLPRLKAVGFPRHRTAWLGVSGLQSHRHDQTAGGAKPPLLLSRHGIQSYRAVRNPQPAARRGFFQTWCGPNPDSIRLLGRRNRLGVVMPMFRSKIKLRDGAIT
jgi:hypothetical protein